MHNGRKVGDEMDREKAIKHFEHLLNAAKGNYQDFVDLTVDAGEEILSLLKDQESLLGIQQTADGITFISTGTAQQGEERGILLGKSLMHEWIYKELLYKGLLTDDIRSVFEQAKRI